MRVALTGATGFIGRYIAHHLVEQGHQLNGWYREESDRTGFESINHAIKWVPGGLQEPHAAERLVSGCEAVVHSALWRPGTGFRGAEGDVVEFARVNILGTLELIEAGRQADVKRFVYLSTCAVHEQILTDRPLDESHPLWPMTHYGAHKAAIEKFVHSYGLGLQFPICAVRPTGVYGINHPLEGSKWFELVRQIVEGQDVQVQGGGKEVHAADVARAVGLLLEARGTRGQSYACYERYISRREVADLAVELSGSSSRIEGERKQPVNQIETGKIRALGMEFNTDHLRLTLQEMIDRIRSGQEGAASEVGA
ncbi:MAG: NAD(P)-dependent oxidoreductase [Mariniblastus sp.]|nr:NAD(P)-dependent oxidoreductase [Mariniblastus sp.]